MDERTNVRRIAFGLRLSEHAATGLSAAAVCELCGQEVAALDWPLPEPPEHLACSECVCCGRVPAEWVADQDST
jgi:hypothetical protein